MDLISNVLDAVRESSRIRHNRSVDARCNSDQQSSITTYLYPTSFNPVVAITVAVSIIKSALTAQPNVFQSSQPIWGVAPKPLTSKSWAEAEEATAIKGSSSSKPFIFETCFF